MKTAKVLLPRILRAFVGGLAAVEASGDTVGEVFTDLANRYPDLGRQLLDSSTVHVFMNVFLDEEDIRYLSGLDTPVGDGSEITILPAVAGGV